MKNKYYPYEGMEFHLNQSIVKHTHEDKEEMDKSQAHFEASNLFQQALNESDHHLRKMKIKKYKQFCADHKIEEFSKTKL